MNSSIAGVKKLNPSIFVTVYDKKTKEDDIIYYVSNRNWDNEIFKTNKFVKCDFSDYLLWDEVRFWLDLKGGIMEAFDRSYYYSGHAPKGFDKTEESNLLVEITSKEQFDELFGSSILMTYSPPDDKK